MKIHTLESFKLSDAVKFHYELNPKLWLGNRLDPAVKKQLLLIAKDFITELGIKDLDVDDITISGSNAAYTYTPHSDLDLHILVDMSKLPNDEVYRELFTAKKTLYNDSHDIKIRGIPIELYVQDKNQPVISLGEYSLLKNSWLKIPKKERANFDQRASKAKYDKLSDLVAKALLSKKSEQVDKALKIIKQYRQAGLDKAGEFGPENLAFKAIRKQGLIQKLYDLRDKLHSKELSIENMYASKTLAENNDYMYGHCHVMALALKKLHPDWQLRAHIGWDEEVEDEEDYRIDHVYIVSPDGSAYDCRGRFDNEQELVGSDETGGVETQFVDYSTDDIKNDIRRGELKSFTRQDLENAMKFAQKILSEDQTLQFASEKTPAINPYGGTKDRQFRGAISEAFNEPYPLKWEKSDYGDYDALAKLPDGTNLSIMFNNEYKKNWMVEFYRNNSQAVTGEGDAQRIFATVLHAIQQFIKKKKPTSLFFSAVKEDDPTGSRTKLYDRLVQRFASGLGYTLTTQADDYGTSYKLVRIKNVKPGVAEGMDILDPFTRNVLNRMEDDSWLSAENAYFITKGIQKKHQTNPDAYNQEIQRFIDLYKKYKGPQGVAEGSDNLNYIGNCTDDDVIEHIFGDATGFAQAVEEYGDEFVLDDLVVKYDPETDVHSFYYKKQGVAESQTAKASIVQTDVYGTRAYHAKCMEPGCDWQSRRYDRIQQAQAAAKKHAEKHFTKNLDIKESASGYIPSNAEQNDPRFKTALTVDIKPDTMKKDAKKFGNKISRAGIPPTLKASGKF